MPQPHGIHHGFAMNREVGSDAGQWDRYMFPPFAYKPSTLFDVFRPSPVGSGRMESWGSDIVANTTNAVTSVSHVHSTGTGAPATLVFFKKVVRNASTPVPQATIIVGEDAPCSFSSRSVAQTSAPVAPASPPAQPQTMIVRAPGSVQTTTGLAPTPPAPSLAAPVQTVPAHPSAGADLHTCAPFSRCTDLRTHCACLSFSPAADNDHARSSAGTLHGLVAHGEPTAAEGSGAQVCARRTGRKGCMGSYTGGRGGGGVGGVGAQQPQAEGGVVGAPTPQVEAGGEAAPLTGTAAAAESARIDAGEAVLRQTRVEMLRWSKAVAAEKEEREAEAKRLAVLHHNPAGGSD
ncbi:hypothetical protein K438DRAFT_1977671 [Mycena galopus ATCC 62051]|nr:hypothetical protein K438DRAFT_1977671 [Mycena galopus ATCC 62051]